MGYIGKEREREERERPWRQYSKKEHTAGRSSSAPNENSPEDMKEGVIDGLIW
jgi:hypothetical protein